MNNENIGIAIVITLLLLSIGLTIYGFIGIYKCQLKLKRNNQVYCFRLFVLEHYPDFYDSLPSYEQMMEDNKPCTISEYLPQLKNA